MQLVIQAVLILEEALGEIGCAVALNGFVEVDHIATGAEGFFACAIQQHGYDPLVALPLI